MQTFDEYLQENLTKADYDNLATKLNMTKNKLTRRLEEPSLFSYNDLLKINDLLLKGMHVIDLVRLTDAGIDKLTVREYRLLKKHKVYNQQLLDNTKQQTENEKEKNENSRA